MVSVPLPESMKSTTMTSRQPDAMLPVGTTRAFEIPGATGAMLLKPVVGRVTAICAPKSFMPVAASQAKPTTTGLLTSTDGATFVFIVSSKRHINVQGVRYSRGNPARPERLTGGSRPRSRSLAAAGEDEQHAPDRR